MLFRFGKKTTNTDNILYDEKYKEYNELNIIIEFNLSESLKHVSIDGKYFEFGVFQGHSINYIARHIGPKKIIYGFDSWQGLPEKWKTKYKVFPKGHYHMDGKIPEVEPNVKLISGLFENTLPTFYDEYNLEPTAFVHIDCDLYSSTKTVFKHIGKTLVTGSIVVFDEWFSEDHEQKAFLEWLATSNKKAVCLFATTRQRTFKIIEGIL